MPHPPDASASSTASAGGSSRSYVHELRAAGTFLVWALLFTGVARAIERGWLGQGPASWIAALVPTAFAVVVVVAHARMLRASDELVRLIQLQALALGLGGGLFAYAGYDMLTRLGAPAAGLEHLIVVITLFYLLGIYLGSRRYG